MRSEQLLLLTTFMCLPCYCPSCTQYEDVITQVWDLHIEEHCYLTFWLVICRHGLFIGCLPQPGLERTVDWCKCLAIWREQQDYSAADLELGTARDQELSDCIWQELRVLDLSCLSPASPTEGSSFILWPTILSFRRVW